MEESIGLSGIFNLCTLGNPYSTPSREPVGANDLKSSSLMTLEFFNSRRKVLTLFSRFKVVLMGSSWIGANFAESLSIMAILFQ